VGADLLRSEPGQAEELQPTRRGDAHDDAVGRHLDLDPRRRRQRRRPDHLVDRTPRRARIHAHLGAAGVSERALVEGRRAGERGAVGDVLQVASSGEEPCSVEREPDEEEAEEEDADDQCRRLPALVAPHVPLR
jgi:hypothetical protein